MIFFKLRVFEPSIAGERELSQVGHLITDKNYEEALIMAKTSLKIFQQRNDLNKINFATGRIYHVQGLMLKEENKLKNAAYAFGQAVVNFQNSGDKFEADILQNEQIGNLLLHGKIKADKKQFEDAALSYEEVAIIYKNRGEPIKSLEIRAKAYVFRAASVNNPSDRHDFLTQAVYLFKDCGIENPRIQGHLEYYSALAKRSLNPEKAILHLESAISYYKKIDQSIMIKTCRKLIIELRKELF